MGKEEKEKFRAEIFKIKSERKMNYAIFGHGDCMRYDVTPQQLYVPLSKKKREKRKKLCAS